MKKHLVMRVIDVKCVVNFKKTGFLLAFIIRRRITAIAELISFYK